MADFDGTTDLTGSQLPRVRGGTADFPVLNITPVLIDPVNRIYQYTDAPGTVVALYEGASLTFPFSSDTTNLYSGSTPSGHYRTDDSRGLFQLGNTPTGTITIDATGAFPVAGAVSTAVDIARYIMTEDMGLPLEYLDVDSFDAANTLYPCVSGMFFDTSSNIQGDAAVDGFLAGLAAKLVPARSGKLRLLVLRALPAEAVPVARFDTTNCVSMTPVALSSTLDPPPYRWRVGYNHNYTVQTTGVLPSATAERQTFVTTSDRYAAFASNTILTAYRRPNDSDPVIGGLLRQEDAQAVANALGALWGVRRRVYSCIVPLEIGIGRDIGDIVELVWPMDDLPGGRLGQIVGEQFRSGDAEITYPVLV
jgi:hypothetical protein